MNLPTIRQLPSLSATSHDPFEWRGVPLGYVAPRVGSTADEPLEPFVRLRDEGRAVRRAAHLHHLLVARDDVDRSVGKVRQSLAGDVGRLGHDQARDGEVEPGPLHRGSAGDAEHELEDVDAVVLALLDEAVLSVAIAATMLVLKAHIHRAPGGRPASRLRHVVVGGLALTGLSMLVATF